MKNKINITDIAKKSGFSITTVSRVINGKGDKYRISKETQEKIKCIANELNYIPNEFARNLRTGKSKTIALIVPSLTNPFFAEIASVINDELRRYGYITLIGNSADDIEIEKTEINHLLSRNIDGIIIAPCGEEGEHLMKIKKKGLPIICVDRYFYDSDLSYVSSNNFEGAYSATKYLIGQGHTHISCIQGEKYLIPNIERGRGFLSAMSDSGITTYSVTGDAFSEQNGYVETKLLLQQKEKPSAIFAFGNTIAMGSLKALKEEKMKLPDDISLITFDNNPYLNYISPPLTCISQPVEDISKIAVKILLSDIQGNDHNVKRVLLKTKLEINESVKNVSNADSTSKCKTI